VRVTLDPTATVGSLVDDVRAQQVSKRAHEHTALTDIQAISETRPAPLFDTIVVVNELHQGTRLRSLGGPFASRSFDLHDQTNFPLTLLAYLDPQIHLKLSYDRRHFAAPAVERVRELLVAVLAAMPDAVDAPVIELPRVPPSEQATMQAPSGSPSKENSSVR